MMIKPVHGSTGEGIQTLRSAADILSYEFPMGDVLLEEKMNIDRDGQGNEIAPSVQYIGNELHEGVTDQIIRGVAFSGNTLPSQTSAHFQKEMRAMAKRVLAWLKPKGPGGLDFFSVNGKPYLVDPNIGRFTGAHPARFFQELYAPGTNFMTWKTKTTIPLPALWQKLENSGICFKPGSVQGVYPLCYLPGMWSMLIAFGDSREKLNYLKAKTDALTISEVKNLVTSKSMEKFA